MRVENISFVQIHKENSFRMDVDYLLFNQGKTIENSISFPDLFEVIEKEKVDFEELESFSYAEITDVTKQGEVNPQSLDINSRNEVNENYFKKIEKGDIILPKENDILISSVRPNLKKYVLVGKDNKIYFTKAFIHLRPKALSKILYYSLRELFYENLIIVTRQGKGYPTIKSEDLKYIKFDKNIIDSLKKNEQIILPKIIQIENEIINIKSQIKSDTEIINDFFEKRFNWDIVKFNELQRIRIMKSNFSSFSNNIDNRFSFKFHNKAGDFVWQTLKGQSTKQIKDYLAEEITLGKSISPSDYDESGEQYYVSMADIKNWRFEVEEAKTVVPSYFNANPNKQIALNDIIMARSGEGTIGKVALIENEENQAVYADFTMRIRLKNYNPAFAYYYFRTDFFQYLIYTHKKGLGNNTNIFPSQLRELPIPEISLIEQEKVVHTIRTETDKQRQFDKKINEKKDEINKILRDAIE